MERKLARIHVSIYIENCMLVVFYVACFASDSGDFNAWRTRDLPSFFTLDLLSVIIKTSVLF